MMKSFIGEKMNTVKVYDPVLRLLHWLLVFLFIISFSIGKFVDDESFLYAYHMLSGFLMVFLVIIRFFWGFIGSKYARFTHFKLDPAELLEYFRSLLQGKTKRELGHNPASSYAALIIFALIILMGGTGLFMIGGFYKEFFEEVHELAAFLLLIVILLHIAGVVFHQIKHHDGMITSMITGKKEVVIGQDPIEGNFKLSFLFASLFILGAASYLYKNFDTKEQTLILFTQKFQLGETDNKKTMEYYNKYYELDEKRED